MERDTDVRIVAADRVEDGLIIGFSDGTSAYYEAQFLYGAREQSGNYLVEEEDDDEG